MAAVTWEFSQDEIDSIRHVCSEQENDPFVQKRRAQNVEEAEIEISPDEFWNAHLTALLTSQQRSGPDSHVVDFLRTELQTVSLDQCRSVDDVSGFVSETLEDHGGIRYYNTIGDACETNLERLDAGGWPELWNELSPLREARPREPTPGDAATEREAARFVAEQFAGEGFHRVGPKQARNVLQILGLTRFETPLDSRITKWLNANLDLPYHVSGSGLSHAEYYHFIMDIVQDGCSTADVLPCLFDAAVFSSYDTNWTENAADAIF